LGRVDAFRELRRWQGGRRAHVGGSWGSGRGQTVWDFMTIAGFKCFHFLGKKKCLGCLKQENDMTALIFSKEMSLAVVQKMDRRTILICNKRVEQAHF
jgi:hypothetical protein